MVHLLANSSTMLEGVETFFLVLSNPAPVNVSDVVFNNGSNATVIINDLNGKQKEMGEDHFYSDTCYCGNGRTLNNSPLGCNRSAPF